MKTVKVRIAVAVDPSGAWNACGAKGVPDGDALDLAADCVGDGEARYWLTAELPIPEVTEVEAAVEPAGEEGYLRAHADTLSAVLVELRAERVEWKGDAPREALRNAIVRIEKLKAGGT